jgi:hypothetical protein
MDATYFSALAGLAGAAIGGTTSFGSSWINQRAQLRVQTLATARKQRENLYVDFVKEGSRLYADALSHERDEITDLVNLYAIVAHLRMVASSKIVDAAEAIVSLVIEAYHGPNHTLSEMRELAATGGLEPFRDFGRACREELSRYRAQEPLRG